MLKTLAVPVPKHVKKFLEGEFAGVEGKITVEKWSELGKLIFLASQPLPFDVQYQKPEGTTILISYYGREKTVDVPPTKLSLLSKQLDEIFRRTLIAEVRSMHAAHGGDYGGYIRTFLERYDIAPDVDVDWETIRKIYRDYLVRMDKKNQARRKKSFA